MRGVGGFLVPLKADLLRELMKYKVKKTISIEGAVYKKGMTITISKELVSGYGDDYLESVSETNSTVFSAPKEKYKNRQLRSYRNKGQ